MLRSLLGLLCLVVAVAGQARAQIKPPTAGAKDAPTLGGIISQRLDVVPGLRASDGVRLGEITFAEGVITIRGKVATSQQRDTVLREVEGLRRTIERTLDIRIKSMESKLEVAPVFPTPAPKKSETPAPFPAHSAAVADEDCSQCDPWSYQAAPWVAIPDNGINAFTDPNMLDKKQLRRKGFLGGKK
jgi:hypothetical protein